jgi:transposase InsO family protein
MGYYSNYFEFVKLGNAKVGTVINHTKSIFARHGIPKKVISDGGPCFIPAEYKLLQQEWGFKHNTSSPYFPKGNGLAERAVQTIKKMLDKAKCSGKDPYWCLLEYRNTPINNTSSPAQLLMNRRLNSIIPSTNEQLKAEVIPPNQVKLNIKNKKF